VERADPLIQPAAPGGARGRLRGGMLRLASACLLLVHHTRLLFSPQTLLALTIGSIVLFGAAGMRGQLTSPADCHRILLFFETGVFILFCMGLITRERDRQMLEMLFVSARNVHQVILMRLIPTALWALALGLVAALLLNSQLGGFAWAQSLMLAFTTGLLWGMVALYLSALTRNAYAALGGALIFAYALYAYYSTSQHQALFDPVVQIFHEKGKLHFAGAKRYFLLWNRFYALALTGLLYDQTIRRMRRIELWMK
jgi:hypothetical protein